MLARDEHHEHVRRALLRDGWTITHDPLRVRWGARDMYIDLGAERLIAAEKAERKIAVEVKSFGGLSPIDDLEKAIGQFVIYHDVLAAVEPERTLYLAVSDLVYDDIFSEPIGQLLVEKRRVRLMVFSTETESIREWTPEPPMVK
ncbi:XisH family protein [Polyangium jinanense]|uniref:XisH family protein n=1 Tax=Polyangium jinanense TaxID=2829994 RepID=A0A9X4AVJ1_9BACT|nr:XisH family protein [Polyangium jinanense]MDC3959322.1 XisH family protein [Polyangium jinanense]MDC3985731.1 XisH family protein [Polyangium jinanense]